MAKATRFRISSLARAVRNDDSGDHTPVWVMNLVFK